MIRPRPIKPVFAKRHDAPLHIAIADRVVIEKCDHYRGLNGREGKLVRIYWSNTGYSRGVYQKRNNSPQWMGKVTLRKTKQRGKPSRVVTYAIPLSALRRAA